MEAVGAHDEQVVGGFHRQEAHAVHLDADRPIEQTHCSAHRGLELNHLGGGGIRWVDGLVIANDRQREHAVALCQLLA